MGGHGSGRWQTGKKTTRAYRLLDVRRLQQDHLLDPGMDFAWSWTRKGKTLASIQIQTEVFRLILKYQHRRSGYVWQCVEYPVQLEWTDCTFGGKRAWFRCPANGCGRRVALLYIGAAGLFACRHCYRLVYECQRKKVVDRATRRADKIREQLGWRPGIINLPGSKPKGMHWSTFNRLKATHDFFAKTALVGMAVKVGLINRKLNGVENILSLGK